MGSIKVKTQIYLLVFSLIVSIMGMAIMKWSRGGPTDAPKELTSAQKLRALEKLAPNSPEMSRFLQREKDEQEANQEASPSLPQSP